MTLNCPTCDSSLTQRSIGGQTIDQCMSCRGEWYDPSELSTILRSAEVEHLPVQTSVEPPREINCPRCQTKIVSAIYAHDSGIPVLKCSQCNGIWLAAGQLEKIARYRNGPHKTDKLRHAMAETFAQTNRLGRIASLIQSRSLSLAFVVGTLVVVAVLNGGNIEIILGLLARLVLPLGLHLVLG